MPASPRRGRAAGLVLAWLAFAAPLAGCAAALVAPVLAGGALIREQGRSDPVAAAPQNPVSASLAQVPAAAPAPAPVSAELPAEALAGAAPWQAFVDFALERASLFGGADPVESALLVEDFSLVAPDRRPCAAATPAVLIDLDREQTAFAPVPGAQPVPGLAENLARLREAGVVVLWLSQADANRVTEIGSLLVAAGLDPTGRDPLLLARNPEDRKQTMRLAANVSVCVLAIAGDRRGDFDELFDYLLDPASAAGLDAMLGSGWFLVAPPVIDPAAPE